jgi:hypothetical protein
MNEPVAWMQTWENQNGELKHTVNIEQLGKNDISLYTQDQLEEARKLGMQQERALWNLSTSTQEIMDTHPVKELTDEEIKDLYMSMKALDQSNILIRFSRELLRKAQEK